MTLGLLKRPFTTEPEDTVVFSANLLPLETMQL